jgi:1,4-alpha-glucan branching enzyme
MSVKKQYLRTSPECKVTFRLSKEIATSINRVNLVGDFNNWNIENIPMRKQKTGEFSVSVTLTTGREYQFRYLLNNRDWTNDTQADKYVPNKFQSENSVIVV